MRAHFPAVARLFTASLKLRIAGILGMVLLFNGMTWLTAILLFRHNVLLAGSAALAFGLGLRHAVDADHIAAIDNATRKLVQDGKRPVGVGLFFSLGHSTIVVVLSVALAITAAGLRTRLNLLEQFGGVAGTLISSGVLFLLAAINLHVLLALLRALRGARDGTAWREEDIARILGQRGLLGRFYGRLFRLVSASWHLYPIGLLFGLGFDTATEIGLLGLSAAEATRGLAIWTILIFPALFTAGMSLIDTLDSILMLGAYSWSLVNPLRKLHYNVIVTGISVFVALAVGGAEVLALLRSHYSLSGRFWSGVAAVSDNFGMIGYLMIAVLALSWIVGSLIYRLQRADPASARAAE